MERHNVKPKFQEQRRASLQAWVMEGYRALGLLVVILFGVPTLRGLRQAVDEIKKRRTAAARRHVAGVGVRDNPNRGFHRHHAGQRLLEQFSRRLRSSSPRKVLVPASP
ncbi:hypothetical protein GYH30_006366 [Glycine max]|nr:hypothetical protein GYH30_006366 [Glycine max]